VTGTDGDLESGMTLFVPSLFDGVHERIEKDRCVIVRGGMIEEISERPPADRARMPLVEIPAGMTLMPGLINAHDHLQLRALDEVDRPVGDKQADHFSAGDAELFQRMERGAAKAARAGVTTLRDCGASGHMASRLAERIREGRATGPRLLVCGDAISSPGGHLAWMGREVRGERDMRRAVEEEIAAGADFIKITVSGGMASAGTDIRSVQFDRAELEAAVSAAHRSGRHVAAHCHSTASIRAAVEAGIDTVEHCSWVGENGIEYDDRIVDEMVRRGTVVVFTNATGYPEGRIKKKWLDRIGTIEQRLEIVRAMLEAGVRTIAGTDDSAFDTLPYEIRLLHRAGLCPVECLRAATGDSALALGIGRETGSIAPGRRADLIAVDGQPLDDLSALSRVTMVMIGGRVVRSDLF